MGIGVDDKGFILEEAKKENIKSPFSELVSEVIKEVLKEFPNKIHSIYVYGSVARGKARMYSSDLDVTVVMTVKPNKIHKKKYDKISKKLEKKYPFVRDVGFDLGSLKEATDKKNYYDWGVWLRHECACVYGPDLGKEFPKYKPSKKVARGLNGDVGEWISKYKKIIKNSNKKSEIKEACKMVTRKMIRSGFSMVCEKEKAWVGKLDICYKIFLKYYPEKKKEIKEVFELAKQPISDKKIIIPILDNLGSWLVKEFKKQTS